MLQYYCALVVRVEPGLRTNQNAKDRLHSKDPSMQAAVERAYAVLIALSKSDPVWLRSRGVMHLWP